MTWGKNKTRLQAYSGSVSLICFGIFFISSIVPAASFKKNNSKYLDVEIAKKEKGSDKLPCYLYYNITLFSAS